MSFMENLTSCAHNLVEKVATLTKTTKKNKRQAEVTLQPNKRQRRKLPKKARSPCLGLISDKPHVTVFCGKKGSGKSRLFLECLLNENGYRNKYHQVVIISPTFRAQYHGLWERLSPLGIKVFDEVTEGLLTELIAQQENNDTNLLVVFDDNGEVFKHIAQSSLNLFISNSRHLRLSCVFLAQKLSQLSTIIRANTDCFVCFSACSFVN